MDLNLQQLVAGMTPEQQASPAGKALAKKLVQTNFEAWCRFALRDRQETPARHHKLIIEKLQAVTEGKIKNLIVLMPPGSAKALALHTPIPTPTGWSTIEELQVGDLVFDEQGFPTPVIRKTQVFSNRKVYQVITDCGDSIVADEDHDWLVCLDRKRPVFKTKKTGWLAQTDRQKRPMVKRASALMLPRADLELEPYLLGYWLGDGHTQDGRITVGNDDRDWFEAEFTKLGFAFNGANYDGRNMVYCVSGLRTILNDMNLLGCKYIPKQYLRGSFDQRLSLLQGLMDTDGTVNDSGESCFSNTNKNLAEGVAELVRSLGAKASVATNRAYLYEKDCGDYYRVHFYLKDSARLPRKAVKTKDGTRTNNTYLSFNELGYTDTACIEVGSPSHLFLCGRSMTPTHNSTYISKLFTPWHLCQHPQHLILACSYAYTLIEGFGRQCRDYIEKYSDVLGYELSKVAAASGDWRIDKGGGYFCAGVGAGIAGHRADIGFIDDFMGSEEQADSETTRQKLWDWWVNDFSPRLKPDAAVIIIANRRHEEDLVGRILVDEPGVWEVVSLPFDARENDPIGRAVGEPLWPEWFLMNETARIKIERARRNPTTWAGLYMQDPHPKEGNYFKKDSILGYTPDQLPKNLRPYVGSDYAVRKGQDADYFCFLPAGLDSNGNLWIKPNWYWEQTNTLEAVNKQLEMAQSEKPVCWWAGRENITGSIAPFLYEKMRDKNIFVSIEELSESKDKEQKAQPIKARMDAKTVFFPTFHPQWSKAEHELLSFPNGKHDDFVDALAKIGQGLAKMVRASKPEPKWDGVMRQEPITCSWIERSHKRRERRLSLAEY